jgi:hypothetical protein
MVVFSWFACYETVFVLDGPKVVVLEISNAAGGVEVFMNGETLGILAKPPYHYDLSNFTRQGENYLAIEVAIALKQNNMTIGEKWSCIIGNVQLYIS